ncbi:MAG: TetR family transcriptional regulator [Streptosporangiales bacterium]|nr:TetR family transcriptional regulator [Streptosporangiales bacterium]
MRHTGRAYCRPYGCIGGGGVVHQVGRGVVSSEDLTARARIRDAAMAEFTERGVKGATIRGIAKAAGVSPGLVQHHFGSKEELRKACDDHVVSFIEETVDLALADDDSGFGDRDFIMATYRDAMPIMEYVARGMVDGSPAADEFFDFSVKLTEDVMATVPEDPEDPFLSDLRARCVMLVAVKLAPLLLRRHLTRALGEDPMVGENYARVGAAMLDIFSPKLSPDLMRRARVALRDYRHAPHIREDVTAARDEHVREEDGDG